MPAVGRVCAVHAGTSRREVAFGLRVAVAVRCAGLSAGALVAVGLGGLPLGCRLRDQIFLGSRHGNHLLGLVDGWMGYVLGRSGPARTNDAVRVIFQVNRAGTTPIFSGTWLGPVEWPNHSYSEALKLPLRGLRNSFQV